MAEANDVYESIYQNLIDAGCSKQSIRQYMELMHEKNILELLKQLEFSGVEPNPRHSTVNKGAAMAVISNLDTNEKIGLDADADRFED